MLVKCVDEQKLGRIYGKHRGMVLASGKSMTLYYSDYEVGMTYPEHSHPHEQVGYCVKGEGEMGIGKEVIKIKPGCGYHVPSNVVHYERNTGKEPLICVDIFCPVREDLLEGYFKQEYFKEGSK
jgi:quercetin dioxygenase-like cupin family protein